MKKMLLSLAALCITGTLFTAKAQSDTVRMVNNQFQPSTLTVPVGTQVVWINQDAMIHTTESGSSCTSNGTWDSGDMSASQTFSFTFNSVGSFPYFCIYHCLSDNMVGTITVVQSTGMEEVEKLRVNNIYPNPSSGQVMLDIALAEAAILNVELFDITGSKVLTVIGNEKRTAGEHKVIIKGGDLAPGIYMCRIASGDKTLTKLISLF